MKKSMGDQDHIKENLSAYIQAFFPSVRDIFEAFEFHTQIDRLAKAGLLYLVAEKFASDHLADARAAMTTLARAYSLRELTAAAFELYETFHPAVLEGVQGWGANGVLDLRTIRSLAKG